ncbi:hypothetical protein JCM15765_37860 [Paradesulfitobacterium aromaticivorans]
MKKIPNKLFVIFMALTLLTAFTVTPALGASDRVLLKAPAKDAAFVASFEGFKDAKVNSLTGRSLSLNEGLIIRQSKIENGKIIIPPSGLYYTTRTPLAKVLQGDKVLILGKEYTLVENGTRIDVVKDVYVKNGESTPIGDGTKRLELSSISVDGNGFDAPKATFQILKPSGNYYGEDFPVEDDAKLSDITKGTLNQGTKKVQGSYQPGEKGENWQIEYYGSSVATSGQSYLVADNVTAEGAHVKEFATGAIDWMLLSDKPAVEMLLAKGEKATLGDYTVTVMDLTSNSATVELTSKDGKVTKKSLGPLTNESFKYLPADPIVRNTLSVRSEKEDVQVQLDAFRKPFHDGKVALVGYTNLLKLKNPGTWPSDNRFIVRPDT